MPLRLAAFPKCYIFIAVLLRKEIRHDTCKHRDVAT